MRVTLPILAFADVALAVAAIWLFEWERQPIPVNNTGVYPGQMAAALGFMVALATTLVALAATVQRRQVGWLSGLIVAWLISAIGSYVAIFVIHPWRYNVGACSSLPGHPCELLLSYWLPWPFLAAPLLVGLVVVLYRFHMRTPVM
jgi:hypothetical protein